MALKNQEKIYQIKKILVVMLWFIYIYLMIMVARDLYQVHKDFHYHIACITLFAIAMLVKNDFKLNFLSFIPAAVIVLGGINYLYDARADFGRDYKLVLLTKYCLFAVIAVWLVSLFLSEKDRKIKWEMTFGGVVLILFAFFSMITRYGEVIYIVVPVILVLSLGKINKNVIKEQMYNLALASCLYFFVSMTISIIKEPHLSDNGRYTGIFFFPIVVGTLSAMCMIAGMYFLQKTVQEWNGLTKKRKIIRIVFCVVLFGYTGIMIVLSGNRSTMLGVFSMICVGAIYLISKRGKRVKIAAVILTLSLLIITCGAIFWMSHNFSAYEFVEKHNINKSGIGYYFLVHLPSVRTHNSTGVFEPGTVLASLDATSSDRLGIWVTGLKKVTLLGKNDNMIILPTGEDAGHVHSTFIFWLMNYGLIAGSLGIIWMIYLFVDSIVLMCRKKLGIIPAMLTAFAFGVFGVERQTFEELLPSLMLILSYRYFYKIED